MEIAEIASFLSRHEPFAALPAPLRDTLSRAIEIRYFPRDSDIIEAGAPNAHLGIVRSGAVELRLGGTELSARLGEGQCFGYPSLLRDGITRNAVVALEDTLLYRLPAENFHALNRESEAFRSFFIADENSRLRRAVKRLETIRNGGDSGAVQTQVGQLLHRRDVVSAHPETPIRDAARLMTETDVSTLPLIADGRLVGIVTDKDLRRRVLGAGRSPDAPVETIMTADPVTVGADDDMLSAMLTMSERNIHHLPVTGADDALIGVLGASDLLNRFGTSAVHVVSRVRGAGDADAVAEAAARLPQALIHLVDSGVDAEHISRFVSSIGEAAHQRLLTLAQDALGPAPSPFALAIFGSLARQEQALGSDQDNGFVFGEGHDPTAHDAYFSELAARLSDGLNAAGYIYCPGDIMATNPRYRKGTADWMADYDGWITTPDPDAILNATIFFDLRGIAGDTGLVDALRADIYARARDNGIFLSFIARAAAKNRVPLGFFRTFLLDHDEREGDVLDLKHQAIAPIVDIARVYALAGGIAEANSKARLAAAVSEGVVGEQAAADLTDCFDFVRGIRFRHQADQIRNGEQPTNKLAPAGLSRFEREHLKDAFKVIREQLDAVGRAFAGGIT
ncbi:cyclic nucleotide-binding/CBS domain-containing protein [Parasphingopyxis algicola]|uniref:putative nucleotidyltransferase substrate binding domain-containing protein n=1 Tax=Parasphingopyxis algicola TaxID=2026624 RepID=UPI0015A228B0|nr:putative nucleotidyltransferase substrate binding domain-containing protein [Parasphingopyxis algicola]QLC26030.1 cyclic nucleotide-binding/CBS domain-containing protein [Parasphingopyxis algicola]